MASARGPDSLGPLFACIPGGRVLDIVARGPLSGFATPMGQGKSSRKGKDTNAKAPSCILLLTGEGAHSATTDVPSLMLSPHWQATDSAVKQLGIASDLEAFFRSQLGVHACPTSPIVTTLINILNSHRWHAAGHEAAFAIVPPYGRTECRFPPICSPSQSPH